MSDSRRLTSDLRSLLPGPFFCAECAERLCTALMREPGVRDVVCDLERGEIGVDYDAALVLETALAGRLRVLAAAAAGSAGHAAYRLSGLD
jgi:copper chaperone CopZ